MQLVFDPYWCLQYAEKARRNIQNSLIAATKLLNEGSNLKHIYLKYEKELNGKHNLRRQEGY